ncbi:hypothetical protein JHU04_000972 [Brenneria sp. 4F2]|nr:hypothetical protein [Brenneria bubanii]
MTKLFLRSGSLDDFLALGENGQPVYASALQLRETLRLRKQQQIADCLAIPQPNERGDRIDWYSPVAGKLTSWIAASEEERAAALKLLEKHQSAVADISQRAQNAEKPAQKLFGVLLAKAIQFPGPNHVYLVDGNPVLTFWGFVNLDKKSRDDALDCLRLVEKAAEPIYSPVSAYEEPPLTEPETPSEPEPQPAAESEPRPAPAAVVASPRRQWLRFWLVLPGVALLAVLAQQIRGWIAPQNDTSEPSALTTNTKPEKRVLAASNAEPKPEVQPVDEAAPAAPPEVAAPKPDNEPPAVTTPEPAAVPAESPSVVKDEPKAAETLPVEAPATPEPPVEAPAAVVHKGELVMPADAVKMGSVSFLNGSWRVSIDVKTPVTGRPPSLNYQIKNGKGTAKITHGDGVICRTNIEAGLMSSGNLVINSRARARCSDNTRYQMPEIVCKQGAAGIAECSGRYNANAVFPMTIKRESKR